MSPSVYSAPSASNSCCAKNFTGYSALTVSPAPTHTRKRIGSQHCGVAFHKHRLQTLCQLKIRVIDNIHLDGYSSRLTGCRPIERSGDLYILIFEKRRSCVLHAEAAALYGQPPVVGHAVECLSRNKRGTFGLPISRPARITLYSPSARSAGSVTLGLTFVVG